MPANVYVVQLCATKASRDVRRINRRKETSKEWREMVDRAVPEDMSFACGNADYTFLRIDNDGPDVSKTAGRIRHWAPELFGED